MHDTTPAPKRSGARRTPGPSGAALAVAEPQPEVNTTAGPLDQHGTRRAPRIEVTDGVEVLVDGNPAALVDISAVSVQVLTSRMLRPNQRVRVALSDATSTIRCDGAIAWASYERPRGLSPRHRAGIELSGGDPAAIKAYAERHKRA